MKISKLVAYTLLIALAFTSCMEKKAPAKTSNNNQVRKNVVTSKAKQGQVDYKAKWQKAQKKKNLASKKKRQERVTKEWEKNNPNYKVDMNQDWEAKWKAAQKKKNLAKK